MTDVPLAETQIIWRPSEPGMASLKVMRLGRPDDRRYDCSWGACNGDFAEADDGEKLRMLLLQFIHLTVADDIPASEVHDALMDIPEYRAALARFGTIESPADE
ncbi:MAG: hypothetical protein JWQ03_3098 [Variovorax sp.]|nr:hypothetical protein [Variovorax sp.]